MMERIVNSQVSSESAGRRGALRFCPHCGGNVRLIRDIYGAYHQCIQCSREVMPTEVHAHPAEAPVVVTATPGMDERLIA